MNTILLTVLITLAGAGLITYFVWLGIVSWKLIKFKRETIKNEEESSKRFDSNIDELHRRIDELILRIDDEQKEIYQNFDESLKIVWDEFEDIRQQIRSEIQVVTNENLENLRASSQSLTNLETLINSRIDQQLDMIRGIQKTISIHQELHSKKEQKKNKKGN